METHMGADGQAFAGEMRLAGGIVGALYSLVRVQIPRRSRNAKRVVEDHPDASCAARRDLVDALVHTVFDSEYLAARGFAPDEASRHNAVTIDGIDAMLAYWTAVAGARNSMPRIPASLEGLLAARLGAPVEVSLRVAAWCVLFGARHPAITHAIGRYSHPALSSWWSDTRSRAVQPWSIRGLAPEANLRRDTLTSIKDGRQIPQDETIRSLCAAIAVHDIRDPSSHGRLTEEEIRFELRTVCAIAQLDQLVEATHAEPWASMVRLLVPFFIQRIRGCDRAATEQLLARGSGAEEWRNIQPDFHAFMSAVLSADVRKELRRLYERVNGDPTVAMTNIASEFEWHARGLSAIDDDNGDVTASVRGMLDDVAEVLRTTAEGRRPNVVPRDRSETEANALVLRTCVPWDPPTSEACEDLLRRALAVHPIHVGARRGLADLFCQSGRFEDAITLLRAGRTLGVRDANLDDRLVLLLLDRGDAAEAAGVIDDPRPNESPMRSVLRAHCLAANGRIEDGATILEGLLTKYPRFDLALSALSSMSRRQGATSDATRLSRWAEFYGGVRDGLTIRECR
jgi:hypothetical protein